MAFVSSFSPSLQTKSSASSSFTGLQCRQQRSRVARRPSVVRMVAAKPAVDKKDVTNLSDRALTLMSYIRGHKSVFSPGEGFVSVTTTLFKKNDTGRTFTPRDQLDTNANVLPGFDVAAYMYDNADALIEQAVELTLSKMSTSSTVSVENQKDILSYDFHAVLRAISYGAACQTANYIHPVNIGMMKMLHDEAEIPGAAVAAALESVRDTVVSHLNDDGLKKSTVECFNAARDALA